MDATETSTLQILAVGAVHRLNSIKSSFLDHPYPCYGGRYRRCWVVIVTRLARSTGHTADDFAAFFRQKVNGVVAATAGQPAPTLDNSVPASLSSFRPCSESDVRRIMSSPAKTCSLDPVPTFLVREFIDLLLPYITRMVNASLSQRRLPDFQKHAVFLPLLKKSGLDASDMANFRPVSNLTFLSKVVARQLNDQLAVNDLLPRHQSAYCKRHSTETARLRVLSDALSAVDGQRVTLMGLLDLTAAFDCVDHSLLLKQLQLEFVVWS